MQHAYKPSRNYTVRADETDDEDKDNIQVLNVARKPYKHYEQTFVIQHVHFYISEEISDPHLYTDMIHRINTAGPNDVIYIHLNTPGGQLDTGVQIINAIQNSSAKIVTVLDGTVYSLGTLIFLAGDEMVVNDHCMIMFHNFKGGVIGKGNELVSQLAATVSWFSTLGKKLYIPFMSEDEFDRMVRGEDIWMHSDEIRERLIRMVEIQAAEAAAVEPPEPEAVEEVAIAQPRKRARTV